MNSGQQYIEIPANSADLVGSGTNRGVITLASTAGFYVGQKGYLADTNSTSISVKILKVLSSTQLLLGLVPNPIVGSGYTQISYQPVDCSAFAAAQSGKLFCPAQIVKVWPALTKIA